MNVVVEAVTCGVYAVYCYCFPLWCMNGVCTYLLCDLDLYLIFTQVLNRQVQPALPLTYN